MSDSYFIIRAITTDQRKSTKKRDVNKIFPNKTDDSTATSLPETTVYVQREIDTIDDKKVWALPVALLAVSFLIGVSSMVYFIYKRSKLLSIVCFT